MNCVSFEIALRLAAAGFPEPQNTKQERFCYGAIGYALHYMVAPEMGVWIAAPTISEILPLIKGRVIADPYGMGFCADAGHIHSKVFISENIHDAVALVWLHENQPK